MVVEKLREKGLLVRTDTDYTHRIATNSRGGGVIEPQLKEQWFVAVNKEFRMPHSKMKGIKKGQRITLKELMLHVVKSKQIEIIPKRFEKIYFHWVNNLHDWCISRQLWYGHRIPAWYCKTQNPLYKKCAEAIVRIVDVKSCPHCKGPVEQDPDTLDTWFSSGMWTFSTLGWPKTTPDLKNYHPTSVIDPGYEILPLWVSRMILMSGYLLGEIPFRRVYFHGIVRDKDGRKFSKSLNNGIDPLDVIAMYGTDALRMSLTVGIGPGSDVRFDMDKVRAYRNFTNKLWNITRFILLRSETSKDKAPVRFSAKQQKYLRELATLTKKVTKHLDTFEFHHAAELLYHYTWHTFADKIIEETKKQFESSDTEERRQGTAFLLQIHTTLLKMLHPFMPFVTEEIWAQLPHAKKKNNLLMVERWPS